jgi:hypothetical protein
MMAAEVDELTGAPAGVRRAERVNHRHGYRERGWQTRVGRIDLAIAKLRPRRSPCMGFSVSRHRSLSNWSVSDRSVAHGVTRPGARGLPDRIRGGASHRRARSRATTLHAGDPWSDP